MTNGSKPPRPDDPAAPDAEGYTRLPGSLQWPSGALPVDASAWRPCPRCTRPIPVEEELRLREDNALAPTGTFTAVCPFCRAVTLGAPRTWSEDWTGQRACHDCETPLGDAPQCPACALPRAWMTVSCPHCGRAQAVSTPHWVVHCDLFVLDCVACMRRTESLCIC